MHEETPCGTLEPRSESVALSTEPSAASRPCPARTRGSRVWLQAGPPAARPGGSHGPHGPPSSDPVSVHSEQEELSGLAYSSTRETDRQIFKKNCMSLILIDVKTFLFSKANTVG